MTKAESLLQNLVYVSGYLKPSIQQGITASRRHVKYLEAIHIRIDTPDPSVWRKKQYYHSDRNEIYSRLDEWIYENLVRHDEYAAYLARYRPELHSGIINDLDEFILNKHYRPKAIRILSKKKSFNLRRWNKRRICLNYRRRSNLHWKNAFDLEFDYRSPVTSLYIKRHNDDKEVLGIGGFGSSGAREINTYFTAVFYSLSKISRIPHYLLNYNGFNQFEYIGKKFRTVVTAGFGSNFSLKPELANKIRKEGLYFGWSAKPAK